jgi:hypothetical protein
MDALMNANLIVPIGTVILVVLVFSGWLYDPLWEGQKKIWRRVFKSWKRAWPKDGERGR